MHPFCTFAPLQYDTRTPTTPPRRVPRQETKLPRRLKRLLSLDDFETAARRHLPRPVFAYIVGGVETDRSVRENREVFSAYGFVPRSLVGVARRSTATTLFGHEYAAPFGIAPMGITALSAYRGDIVLTRAAASANLPMVVSGSSLIPLEDIARENPRAWFQAYLPGDDAAIEALIGRVARAGFETLMITVDIPVPANRENNVRAGFSTPLRPSLRLAWDGITHPRWLLGTFARTILRHGMPHFENNYATRGAPILSPNVLRDYSDRAHFDWSHLALLRRIWKGRFIVKGILDARDARSARDAGVDGIVVSNHGGRQLDGVVSPLRVLAAIVAACPEIPVMFDSGVRRGTDVLTAFALGARFVFVGRPFNYAAAVGGEAGVAHAIALLAAEVSRDMAMLGVNRMEELAAGEFLMKLR